jgi:hypothetical protein
MMEIVFRGTLQRGAQGGCAVFMSHGFYLCWAKGTHFQPKIVICLLHFVEKAVRTVPLWRAGHPISSDHQVKTSGSKKPGLRLKNSELSSFHVEAFRAPCATGSACCFCLEKGPRLRSSPALRGIQLVRMWELLRKMRAFQTSRGWSGGAYGGR